MLPSVSAKTLERGTVRKSSDGTRWRVNDSYRWGPYTKRQEFEDMITSGKLSKVKELIEKDGMSPKNMVNKYSTPLMLATSYGHINIVRYLLKLGVDPTVKTKNGVTALFHCIEGYDHDRYGVYPPRPQIMELLLKDPRVNPNQVWDTGYGDHVHILERAVSKVEYSGFIKQKNIDFFEDRLRIVQLLLDRPDIDKAEVLKQQNHVAELKDNMELKRLFYPKWPKREGSMS
jgi:hypothetical protein